MFHKPSKVPSKNPKVSICFSHPSFSSLTFLLTALSVLRHLLLTALFHFASITVANPRVTSRFLLILGLCHVFY